MGTDIICSGKVIMHFMISDIKVQLGETLISDTYSERARGIIAIIPPSEFHSIWRRSTVTVKGDVSCLIHA